jgi:hypothetical protein
MFSGLNVAQSVEPSSISNFPSKLDTSVKTYLFAPNYTNSIALTRSLPLTQFENLVTFQDTFDNAESFTNLKNLLA